MQKILVTGSAGFIGSHLVNRLCERGDTVWGIDNINDYYNVQVKYGRLKKSGIDGKKIAWNIPVDSSKYPGYRFVRMQITDKENINQLYKSEKFDKVCHLAAQAGVRYSITNPDAYIESNIVGFLNILEACRHYNISHLVYASSSSVYGLNARMPFSTHDNVDHPISLYAATKKSNELMAHTYSYLYGIPTTGLRFFTVYGPWGRPDMALFLFTKSIIEGKPINVFNNGDMKRDFTYIDDIVEGVIRSIDNVPKKNPDWSGEKPDPASSLAPYKIYNIGNNSPVKLMDFIEAIEIAIGKKTKKIFLPLQQGDVPSTWADSSDLFHELGYKPTTKISEGISHFVEWYINFFGEKNG
jgi:UDP-glucuronate 4-epimerase